MHVPRGYEELSDYLRPGKVLVLTGPRQVGKTTLVRRYLERSGKRALYVTGDDVRVQEAWGSARLDRLQELVEGYEVVVIDEAQRVPNIGLSLKLLVDAATPSQLIATGSSSFQLSGQLGEPLTGRQVALRLYPLSQLELRALRNRGELREHLEEHLIYGSYPEVVTAPSLSEKRRVLDELVGSYLLKDVLELERVKSSKLLLDLLRLIAFQVGSLVSHAELGTQLGLDSKTVARYLDLLEKGYVLFNVRGFSRNLRKEITKKSKYFFYDTGVRNAVIANFNDVDIRNDTGQLWENFLFVERFKLLAYTGAHANHYFWRTWDGQEIDMVEEREGRQHGYEFKWGGRPAKAPRDWTASYRDATYTVVNRESWLDFVT
jgi:predicted AAA+ superfamily ATPase